jgi:hypothetical protein
MPFDRSIAAAFLHVVVLSAAATWIVHVRRTSWLLILGLLAVPTFSWWWISDGGYRDGPTWLLVFISTGYVLGTIAVARLMNGVAVGPATRFVVTALGGMFSFFVSAGIGLILWSAI